MNRNIPERDFPINDTMEAQIRFLIHYAAIAPSSHNTQPWKFRLSTTTIEIFIDKTSWLQVADHDMRELYVSIGCVLENILIAANHFGLGYKVEYTPSPNDQMRPDVKINFIKIENNDRIRNKLFDVLTTRCTNHNIYKTNPVPETLLQELRSLSFETGVNVWFTSEVDIKRNVDRLIEVANAQQFANPEWRYELAYWLGRGVFGTSWIMSKISQLAVAYLNLSQQTTKKDSELLNSAPILGAITTTDNNRESQIKAGQTLERLWLKATHLGLSLHPMNQILQIPQIKQEVVQLLPSPTLKPQITFRLGFAEADEDNLTPRKDIDEMII